jgi:hypothetical protein
VAGRWAAVAFSCVAVTGERFVVLFLAAGFVAVAVCDLVVAARRCPPRRVGRVERRLPSTLASVPVFAPFFDFFLDDF